MPSANQSTMCTFVEELPSCYDYFLRLSGFLDLFGKVFLITFDHSIFDLLTFLLSLISFFIMQRDYNGCNYGTFWAKIYFSVIRVLKSKKKKLAVTLFYCFVLETWLDDSRKLIYINQLRFYNFSCVGKFKDF